MAFRFANCMFEPVWNRNYIDHIQITAAEDIGIGSRAGYYDQRGRAARPRAEPHAAAADAACAWSRRRPSRPTRCATRRSRCCRRSRRRRPRRCAETTVRAQYAAGVVGRRGGRRATSRRRACPTTRTTETYAALQARGPQLALGGRADLPAHRQAARAQGDRDRRPAQAGAAPRVPVARARSACSPTSSSSPCSRTRACRCRWARRSPARRMRIRPVNMEFLYGSSFMSQSPEAYERLILDAMRGDATLFTRNDEVDRAVVDHRPDPAGLARRTTTAAADVRGRLARARRRPTS